MPIPSSETGISAQKNVPILCLDTCAILDILRDPTRRDVRIHEQEASLVLLRAAESGSNLEALIADQVSIEFRDNVQKVEKDAADGLSKLRDQIDKLDKLTTLHGLPGQVNPNHWKDYVVRCRNVAERWLKASTPVAQSDQIVVNAFRRVSQARSPAQKGKDSMKDCVILETYLEYIRRRRNDGLTAVAVFVSSNTKDYAETNGAVVRKDLENEFKSLELEYAPNMAAAKHLLGL